MPIDPPQITRPAPDLAVERLAREFASMQPGAAEAILDMRIAEAVRLWRLEEATHWQKIKYKARWMRGLAHRAGDDGRMGRQEQG